MTSALDGVLDEFGAEIHVVAHTPVPSIESRYDGRLLAVDLERPATEMLLLEWGAGGGGGGEYRSSFFYGRTFTSDEDLNGDGGMAP